MNNNTSEAFIEVKKGARWIGSWPVIAGSRVQIGRSDECDIVLDSKEISRRHVIIQFLDTGFKVEDLSLNGCFVDTNSDENGVYRFGSTVSAGPFFLFINGQADIIDQRNIRSRALSALITEINTESLSLPTDELRTRVEGALDRILFSFGLDDAVKRKQLLKELRDEAVGLGPLEKLLADDNVNEIMVISHDSIWIEEKGKLTKTGLFFSNEDSVRTVIDRIVAPLGRRIDESSPMVDARLPDGSRVNAVIPPLALKGCCITIRKFSKNPFKAKDLVNFGSMNDEIADLLLEAVKKRQNIVISGGTGSGKTTLLNVLSSAIPEDERIVTVEDAAELSLSQPHVVSLESKPSNAEGKGEITIRDLVKNTLRMRPDRIVVGECRGGEALDMLQAMNTGHDGSLTTTHANSPKEAIARLETLCLMSGVNLPSKAIREQIAGAVDLIVQQSRLEDGSRKIMSIAEVIGMKDDGTVRLEEIYKYVKETSCFEASGWIPAFMLEAAQ